MQTTQIASALEAFERRGAGSNSERRAALWLAGEMAKTGRTVKVETFWCRPNWALAQAWHVALAVAGSLVSVSSPRVGGALLLAALVFIVMDELTGVSPGRRLTPEHASQNVIGSTGTGSPAPVRLILTANYDSGRTGLAYRDWVRTPLAAVRSFIGGLAVGWLGWLAIAVMWLEAIAIIRLVGHHGTGIGAVQLPPTIALVFALALLIDLASSDFSPGAGDNGSGVGVVMALLRALDTARHANVNTDVVLTGAGDGGGVGLRAYLRAHRNETSPADTVVLGIAPCAAGRLRWWRSDGRLLPLAYGRRLTKLAAKVANDAGYLDARPYDGRGFAPALCARMARIPSVSIGCLDDRGLVPRSHQASDFVASLDPAAAGAAVQFGLMLVDEIDAELADSVEPATAAA
jgi:hypothetical protein